MLTKKKEERTYDIEKRERKRRKKRKEKRK